MPREVSLSQLMRVFPVWVKPIEQHSSMVSRDGFIILISIITLRLPLDNFTDWLCSQGNNDSLNNNLIFYPDSMEYFLKNQSIWNAMMYGGFRRALNWFPLMLRDTSLLNWNKSCGFFFLPKWTKYVGFWLYRGGSK